MKERGKAVDTYRNFSDFGWPSSEIPCKKHPYSSPVGICPYCLKDRLVKLVCSDCGKQRASSCSCSDTSSSLYRSSCSRTDIGSVGRISFLIDNEKIDRQRKDEKSEKVDLIRRSSSSCVEVKKSNGFWRIKKLLSRRNRYKGRGGDVESCDENSEICVSNIIGVSRSRSLCSFRGGRNNNLDEGSDCAFSNAKISDVTSGIFFDSDKQFGYSYGYEPRKSGIRGSLDVGKDIGLKWGRRGGCPNQVEFDRACGVPNGSVFPIKESDFSGVDDAAFIELKLDSLSEDCSAGRISRASDRVIGFESESFEFGESLASLRGNGLFGKGGSCRITFDERESKRGSRNYKVWRWIFKHHTAAYKEEK